MLATDKGIPGGRSGPRPCGNLHKPARSRGSEAQKGQDETRPKENICDGL